MHADAELRTWINSLADWVVTVGESGRAGGVGRWGRGLGLGLVPRSFVLLCFLGP